MTTQPYNEKFEKGIIVAMSLVIILSFIGVAALWSSNPPHCDTMKYTYCGDPKK